MSFMSLFVQAKSPNKPYKCRSCSKRFTMKAHAANHKKQSSSASCRRMGFIHVGMLENSFISPRDVQQDSQIQGEVNEMEELEFEELKIQNEPGVEFNEDQVDEVLQIGDELESVVDALKQERLTRKGCMKATPFKIACCLRRMITLREEDSTMSNRAISVKVASEFSTKWRNCYRWMFE